MNEQLTIADGWPEPAADRPERPKRLLTNGNRDLARDRIYTWTLPALAARLPDGRTVRTCPAAGVCAQACYARSGTYNFRNVKAAHLRNLLFVVQDPDGWERAMCAELCRPRMVGSHVRIHDAGDFLSDEYLAAWLRIIRAHPAINFYAYTKEVERYRRMVEPDPPPNSRWILSLGGREDHLVDLERDRVADVFPTEASIAEAGWHSQAASDLLAAYGPTPVGMAANNIRHFKARQGERTFGQWQREADGRRSER